MIWAHLNTGALQDAYALYLLTLEGAISRAAGMLDAGPAHSIRLGEAAVEMATRSAPDIAILTRDLVEAAVKLGAEHASGHASDELVGGQGANAAEIAHGVMNQDRIRARQVVQQQALIYSVARQGSNHTTALLKATGQLGQGVFQQLDRRGRSLQSKAMLIGHARLAAARGYLAGFLEGAAAVGATHALVSTGGGEKPERVAIAELDPVLFHPSMAFELELAP